MEPIYAASLPAAHQAQPQPATTELGGPRRLYPPATADVEAAAHQHLRELLEQAPVAIFLVRGPAYILDLVNPLAAASWGRSADQVRGLPFFEALPDLRGQGYEAAYAAAWQTQRAVRWQEAPITLARQPAGPADLGYFNVAFQPLHDKQGQITSLLVTSHDVTEQVLARQRAHQATAELAALNAGLADYVLELTQAAHLAQGQAESQASTLARLLEQAPLAIGLFVGADYVVEVGNPSLLKLWGCSLEQVLHQPLFEGLPALLGQGLRELLDEVRRTGIPAVAHQPPRIGEPPISVALLCYPLRDAQGHITAITAVAASGRELAPS